MDVYKSDNSLKGLRGDNFSDYFKMMFEVWLIMNSKEVIVDGEVFTGNRKNFFATFGFKTGDKYGKNIKKPSSIIANGISEEGVKLTESRFAKVELERVEKITDSLNQMMKFARLDYIEYLKDRTMSDRLGFERDSEKLWFKFGVLLAKGDVDKYYNDSKTGIKNGYSALGVAKELGNSSYEKYVLVTLNNYPADNPSGKKNIFNRPEDMKKIISYCDQQGYAVSDYFKSRIKPE